VLGIVRVHLEIIVLGMEHCRSTLSCNMVM
jgi:hypothetical protein